MAEAIDKEKAFEIVEECVKDSGKKENLLQYLGSLDDDRSNGRKLLRKLKLDFDTVIEVAS